MHRGTSQKGHRYNPSAAEDEILVPACKQYFAFKKKSPDRERVKEETLAALLKLNPQNTYWNVGTVRRWFTNNKRLAEKVNDTYYHAHSRQEASSGRSARLQVPPAKSPPVPPKLVLMPDELPLFGFLPSPSRRPSSRPGFAFGADPVYDVLTPRVGFSDSDVIPTFDVDPAGDGQTDREPTELDLIDFDKQLPPLPGLTTPLANEGDRQRRKLDLYQRLRGCYRFIKAVAKTADRADFRRPRQKLAEERFIEVLHAFHTDLDIVLPHSHDQTTELRIRGPLAP
jgi:hypothetical protein